MVLASIGGTVRNAFVVFFAWLPHVVGALAVLLIGWFVARLVAALVARALGRAGLDRRMHRGLGGTAIERAVPRPAHLIETEMLVRAALGETVPVADIPSPDVLAAQVLMFRALIDELALTDAEVAGLIRR